MEVVGLGGREEVCPARTKWEALEACRQIRGALEAFLGVVVWSRVLEVVRVRRSSRDRLGSSRYLAVVVVGLEGRRAVPVSARLL